MALGPVGCQYQCLTNCDVLHFLLNERETQVKVSLSEASCYKDVLVRADATI